MTTASNTIVDSSPPEPSPALVSEAPMDAALLPSLDGSQFCTLHRNKMNSPRNNNDFTFGHCRILGREEPPFALLCRAVSWLKKVDSCVETFHLKCLMLTFALGFFPFLGVSSGAGPRKVLWN